MRISECSQSLSAIYLLTNFTNFRTNLSKHLQMNFPRCKHSSCRTRKFFESNVVIDDNIDVNESFSNDSSQNETTCHSHDVLFVKTYLISVNAICALNFPILLLMIYHSARGSITDTKARRFVSPLLYLKSVALATFSYE